MGPLEGLRVIELAGRGPGPFAGMLLSDMGADVVRVDRPAPEQRAQAPDERLELVSRGRRSVTVDLKRPGGAGVLLRMVERADVLVEGYRPGVMERLGVGPEACLGRNRRLVFARLTGWGQEGPLAQAAAHDINYIALAGALEPIGRRGSAPVPPLNLVGDYAGGGMLAAFGIVCAVLEARSSGAGQVIDAAMVDGASLLMTVIHGRRLMGAWRDERGTNYLDSGAPFYDVYETSDGCYVSVGAIEERFYTELLDAVGLDAGELPARTRENWPQLKERIAGVFRTRTRAQWCELLEGTDACFAPVLGLWEVHEHPHHRARAAFVEAGGARQPAPAPRLGRTPGGIAGPPPLPGEHTRAVLGEYGFTDAEIADLRAQRVVGGERAG